MPVIFTGTIVLSVSSIKLSKNTADVNANISKSMRNGSPIMDFIGNNKRLRSADENRSIRCLKGRRAVVRSVQQKVRYAVGQTVAAGIGT